MKDYVRYIPPIHELQKNENFSQLAHTFDLDSNSLNQIVKKVVDEVRGQILQNCWEGDLPGSDRFIKSIFELTEKEIEKTFVYTLNKVINATGTILHTNLGRARLSKTAMNHVIETAKSYSNLEYVLDAGERGSRHDHVEALVKRLTGAESAMVVNNNAAAVFLILRALASEKEVIVSRGQLVEIGGSFRISSIMEESGAKLVEVGTTNKTHRYDYEGAIGPDTAMLMKVHTSNFKVIGFTKSVDTHDLVDMASEREHVIVYEDLGSGALYDYGQHGIGDEPVVKDVLKLGVDIVSFSGDKLLGGPQAGIIAGKKNLIDKLKKHQLARVLRVDKMTLAALEGTLLDYVRGGKAIQNIPTVRDLLATKSEIKDRTIHFMEELNKRTSAYTLSAKESFSQVGGGTMPEVQLPTYVAAVKSEEVSAENLARKLRTEYEPPIIVRIQKDEILIDLRSVAREEETDVINSLVSVSKG